MPTPAEILRVYLLTLTGGDKIGVDPDVNKRDDWPVYHGRMPDSPDIKDNAIAVIDTQGIKDGRYMQGQSIVHPGIQIFIRAKDKTIGYTKAVQVFNRLDLIVRNQVDIASVAYTIAAASNRTPIMHLGQEIERTRRWQFTVNATLTLI